MSLLNYRHAFYDLKSLLISRRPQLIAVVLNANGLDLDELGRSCHSWALWRSYTLCFRSSEESVMLVRQRSDFTIPEKPERFYD